MNSAMNNAKNNEISVQDAVERLKTFVGALVSARVKTSDGYRKWCAKPGNEAFMAEVFGYERLAGMPPVTAVVKPFFHPEHPLVGINYTQVAHNTLHQFASGWTPVLKLCRGIVFSRRGALVAFPFPKFFNYGEGGNSAVPDLPFTATLKQEGHLAIIFQWGEHILATTRGSFVSSSSILANEALKERVAAWKESGAFKRNTTVLCEFIHPETHVIVDYGDRVDFVLIGAYSTTTLKDLDYPQLSRLGARLGLTVTTKWSGKNMADLIALVKETKYQNEEGLVARFADGSRLKFKYAGYISMMLGEKLSHRYVMLRLMDDSFEKRFADLDGEIKAEADRLCAEINGVKAVTSDSPKATALRKAQREFLYGLVPEEERTPYYRGICGKYLTWLDAQAAS